jgi:phosphate/sulfate permease
VSETIRSGIADPSCFVNMPAVLMYGMMCVDLASGIWLLLATYLELPVSTTHSAVGGVSHVPLRPALARLPAARLALARYTRHHLPPRRLALSSLNHPARAAPIPRRSPPATALPLAVALGSHLTQVIGMALVAVGSDCVVWNAPSDEFPFVKGVTSIVLSWVFSPVLSGVVSMLAFLFVRKFILRSEHSVERAFLFFPLLVAFTVCMCCFYSARARRLHRARIAPASRPHRESAHAPWHAISRLRTAHLLAP